LIAVVGISPAILTETVWALANPRDGSQPVIPDDVVAITTVKGSKAITDQLLTPAAEFGGLTVWRALHREILGQNGPQDDRLTLHLRIIEQRDPDTGTMKPLEDIWDREQNLAAAEFILRQVRDHTNATDRRLIASLAGGRKTMSALLHAAVSHLGRPQDRLTHVLVTEPFEQPGLKPPFFFPSRPPRQHQLCDRAGNVIREVSSSAARIELADVPFAPLRIRFPDIAEIPTRFSDLIRAYSNTFRRDATQPAVIELLRDPPRVVVDGFIVELEGERQLTVLEFLFKANQKQWLQKDQGEAAEIFKAWHGYPPQTSLIRPALRSTIQKLYEQRRSRPGPAWIERATSDDIKRPLSALRRPLDKKKFHWVPKSRDLELPAFRLVKSV
jgi:CRISPR-associated protein (TIGR02584 family)